MKRTAAAGALVIGFSALSFTPASAAVLPFPNCTAAELVGVYNIPQGTPGYGEHLDRDNDGIACDNADVAYNPGIVAELVAENQPQPPVVEQPPVAQPPVAEEPLTIGEPEYLPAPEVAPEVAPEAPVAGGVNAGVNLDAGIPAEKDSTGLVAGLAAAGALAAAGGVLLYRRTRA